MMKFRENEDAVSPVIGVILMVAITVILAAVIAAFVFGMAGSVDTKNKAVAATATATVSGDTKMISITYMGGSDASLVDGVHYTVANATETKSGWINGSDVKPTTGNTTQISVEPKDEKKHVVVSAYFADGSSQVILDNHV